MTKNLYLQIVKGAPHPNASLAFVNWMLTKEARHCLQGAGYPAVVEGVPVHPELAPFPSIQQKVIPADWSVFQEKAPELLLRWNKEIDG